MTRVAHCSDITAHIMLSETAESPYFLRKVMRKPKPMKIITWTSWNTEQGDIDEYVFDRVC